MPKETEVPSRHAVSPQAGEWLVCVQTFKGVEARMLAEEMAELLIRDYKLSAYLYDRSMQQRSEEQERVQKLRDQHWDAIEKLKAQGIPATDVSLRYRTVRVADEFAVLVGRPNKPFRDMDTAREFLNDLRRLKPPPDKFSNRAIFGDDDGNTGKIKQVGAGTINPFQSAMVVHNPSMPTIVKQDDPDKADDFLKELNAGEEYSLLRCRKQWTLMVKMYQGQAILQTPKKPSIMSRLGFGKKETELLNASAAQAHGLAKYLRETKPSFDAYVMHGRAYSLVTVGQYDTADDPTLLANQKALAKMQLKAEQGVVLDTLSAQPLPMKIPK